jgi:hypothetical protein
MALAGLFPGKDFSGGGPKERDEFGEGCGELMFQRDLAKVGTRGMDAAWIRLPKDMESHMIVSGVDRMRVGVPIGGVAVQLDVTGKGLAVGGRKGGAKKVGTSTVIPDSWVVEGDFFSRKGGEWVADELFKPDPLQDRFGENGSGLFPEDVFPSPTAIGEHHGDETGKKGKGCGAV